MKFLCICQSGLGSSFMVQMNIQNLLNSEGVAEEIAVEHADVGSTTADMADYFFVEKTLGDAVSGLPQDRSLRFCARCSALPFGRRCSRFSSFRR